MHASKPKTRTKKHSLALVLGGGGMSTSYIVGFLEAFKKKYKMSPNIIIAGSGSAGTASYFVGEQLTKGMKNIWLEKIPSKRFVSGTGFKRYIDIDFLIDEVFKKKPKLNIKKIQESKTILLIPMVNSKTGSLKYFSNKDRVDWFEVLRAGKAIPIFYDKSVRIGNASYHDSHLSAVPETHTRKARSLGASHIISIHTTGEVVRVESGLIEGLWFMFKKSYLFRKQYNNIKKIQEGRSEDNLTIFPSQKPFATLLDTNTQDIVDTIALGYRDCVNNTDLELFIENFLQNK